MLLWVKANMDNAVKNWMHISRNLLKKLWDKMQKISSSYSRSYAGIGISFEYAA